MGIIRDVEKFIRTSHSQNGAVISPDTPFEIIRIANNATDMLPGLQTGSYNRFIEYRLGEYRGYARLISHDLTTFWRLIQGSTYFRKMVIRSTVAASTHDILADINNYTRLDLPINTVVDTPIPDGTYEKIRIVLNDKHPWFTGYLDVPLQFKTVIKNGKPVVKLPIAYKLHECARDPAASTDNSRCIGSIITYSINYTKKDDLLSIPTIQYFNNEVGLVDMTVLERLRSALNASDDHTWRVSTSNTTNNLYGAFIVYNGPVGGYNDYVNLSSGNTQKEMHFGSILNKLQKPRTDREYVMAILPNIAYCSNLRNEPIFIHYGDAAPVEINRPPLHYWPLRNNRLNYGTDPKRPEFMARGEFMCRSYSDRGCFMLTMGATTAVATKHNTPIGVDLPVNKDFSLVFDVGMNYFAYTKGTLATIGNTNNSGLIVPHNYFNITDNAVVTYKCELGQPKTTRIDTMAADIFWPSMGTVAITRRNDNIFIYTNGVITATYTGVGNDLTVLNSLISYGPGSGYSFRDMRYFDYALSASQVRTVNMGVLDPVVEDVTLPYPEPKHMWELNGSTVDKGTTPIDLNKIFSYRADDKAYHGKLIAYNTNAGGSKLGVELDVSADFTVAFTMCFNNPPSGYESLGAILSGNGTHRLGTFGTSVILVGSPSFESSAIRDSNVSMLTNINLRIQLVRKGDWLHYYLDGLYVRCQKWVDKSTTYWDNFGGPETLSTVLGFRNLTYYDSALSVEHLQIDAERGGL